MEHSLRSKPRDNSLILAQSTSYKVLLIIYLFLGNTSFSGLFNHSLNSVNFSEYLLLNNYIVKLVISCLHTGHETKVEAFFFHSSLMRILARRIWCCGCNIQIHMDYRNPVEKKGWHGHSLSERGQEG